MPSQTGATGGRVQRLLPTKMTRPVGGVVSIGRSIPEPRQQRSYPSTIQSSLWPIGSIFMATVSTNPLTLFGFGIWSAVHSDIWVSIGSVNLYIWQRTA